jgi:plastocyanin
MTNRTLILAVAAALACSGGDDGPSQPTDGNSDLTVSVTNNLFTPSSLSVPVNSTVTWQWNSGGVAHNVTFQDGTASSNLTSGSFPRTFAAAGTYSYVCTIHAAQGMAGTVTVTSTSGGTGGGGSGGGGGGAYP